MDPSYDHFRILFNKKNYRIEPTVISYRLINHWDSKGLIPESCRAKSQKWRYYSLVDLVWIAIIKGLREFEVGLPFIQKVKSSLKVQFGISEFSELEFYISWAAVQKVPCEILIFRDGSAEIATIYEIEDSKEKIGLEAHFNFSLNMILQSVMPELDLQPNYSLWVKLEQDVAKIVNYIKTGNYKEISVEMKNGKVETISTTELHDPKSQIHGLLRRGEYQEVSHIQKNGKVLHIKRKKTERL